MWQHYSWNKKGELDVINIIFLHSYYLKLYRFICDPRLVEMIMFFSFYRVTKLHKLVWRVQFKVFENSRGWINLKFHEKSYDFFLVTQQ